MLIAERKLPGNFPRRIESENKSIEAFQESQIIVDFKVTAKIISNIIKNHRFSLSLR